jgi:hypothetical protein
MTNGIAIGFVLIVGGAIAADLTLNAGSASLFMARQGLDLVQWLAFWR